MQIILRGPAAGYEAEHTARLFFPDAEKTENLPQDSSARSFSPTIGPCEIYAGPSSQICIYR